MRLVALITFAVLAVLFLVASAAAASGTSLPANAGFFLAAGLICGVVAWLISKLP